MLPLEDVLHVLLLFQTAKHVISPALSVVFVLTLNTGILQLLLVNLALPPVPHVLT
jgi:hypothetical protein